MADRVDEERRIAVHECGRIARYGSHRTAEVVYMHLAQGIGRRACLQHKRVDQGIVERIEMRGRPIITIAGRRMRIQGLLPRSVGHAAANATQRLAESRERRHSLFALREVAAPAVGERDDALAMHRRWQERRRRRGGEDQHQRARLGRGGREGAKRTQQRRRGFERVKQDAGQHFSDGMQAKSKSGHHAEAAGAATQRPEEIGVLLGVCDNASSIGQHDIGFEQVVDRQTCASHQPTDAPAQGVTANTRGRDEAAGGRESVRLGRLIDIAPQSAAFDPRNARLRIDLDAIQGGEVQHQGVVAHGKSGDIVAPAAHRYREMLAGCELGDRADVFGIRATRDRRWAAIDRAIPDMPAFFVFRASGQQQLPAHARGQLLQRLRPGVTGFCRHCPPPFKAAGVVRFSSRYYCDGLPPRRRCTFDMRMTMVLRGGFVMRRR